jgi:hypothetical protein
MSACSDLTFLALLTLFAILGVTLVIGSGAIQRWILAKYEKWSGVAGWNPLLRWMKTDSYRHFLRLLGAIICVFVAFVLLENCPSSNILEQLSGLPNGDSGSSLVSF